jgi:hypothetical protein
MLSRVKFAAGVAVVGVASVGTAAVAHDRARLATFLHGYEEVPAISTAGNGTFKARISRGADEIRYTLVYNGPLNGTVTQAHIHFAQRSVNGGIALWLCGTPGFQPAAPIPAPPACPAPGTPVSGVLTPAHVAGPAGQGIAAGEFDEVVRALRSGVTYANVHTTAHGGGEIRGQIDSDQGRDD